MMNQRIRELVKQAGGHISMRNLASNPVQHRESVELWDDKIEKFAELIVKECAQFVEDKFDFIGEEIIVKERMLEHFGVEE
jgi:hypothetical protein